MRLASEALRDGAIGQVQELLRAHEPRRGGQDLRGFEWRYLRHAADQTGLVTHQLQGLRGTGTFPSDFVAEGGVLYNYLFETGQILAWDLTNWAPLPLELPAQRASERWWWRPWRQAALAVNENDATIAVYRLPNFEEVSVIRVPGKASQAAVSKDLRTLAVGFQDGDFHRILLWDLAANSQRGVFGNYLGKVTDLGFSPDDTVLVAACDDGEIGLWSIADGKALPSPTRDPSSTGEDWEHPPFFGPGSTRLFLKRGRERKALEVWDWSTGKLAIAYQAHFGQLGAFSFSPDGSVLASASAGEAIVLLDTKESRQIGAMPANGATIISLAFSPTDHIVAWTGWNALGILDYQSGQTNIFALTRHGFCNPAFSPDGREIAFAGPTNIMIWNMATRAPRPFAAIDHAVIGLAFSPNGSLLASAHRGGNVTLWERASGRAITNILGHAPDAHHVEFSPDGRLLASAGSGSDGTVKLWDVSPGGLRLRHTLRGHLRWVNLVFSADGRRVVSRSGDGTLKLWDTKTGLQVGTLYGHRGGVVGCAFSRDGNTIYSAAEDGDVRVWRAPPLDRLEARVSDKPSSNPTSHPSSENN